MVAYYNENSPYPAQWTRNLIAAGLIPAGDVDERSIADVRPDDLRGYAQCHFFAGIGGWAYAGRLAGWPDDRPWWTGSCPCQGESVAGRRLGKDDARHLWPVWFPLIAAERPAVVMGEQVARAAGTHWLDGVCDDMESIGYTVRPAVIPACAVDAPHRRDRLWFVADAAGIGRSAWQRKFEVKEGQMLGRLVSPGCSQDFGNADEPFSCDEQRSTCRELSRLGGDRNSDPKIFVVDDPRERCGEGQPEPEFWRRRAAAPIPSISGSKVIGHNGCGAWSDGEWLTCADEKDRRVKPGVRLLAHGVSQRVGRIRALGNAIVPQVAAEVIAAWMECEP